MFRASRWGIEAAASWTFVTRTARAFSLARRCGGTTSSTIGNAESRCANATDDLVGGWKHGSRHNPFRFPRDAR